MSANHLPAQPQGQPSIAACPNGIKFLPPVDDPEILRVLAIGSRPVVNIFVHRLHQVNIAHFSEWSRLLPTPNPNEFMRILTKRIPIDREALPAGTRPE